MVAGQTREGGWHGVLVVTDQRVCFFRKRLIGQILWQSTPAKLAVAEAGTELGARVLRLVTAEDGVVFKTYARKNDFDAVYALIQSRRSGASPTQEVG